MSKYETTIQNSARITDDIKKTFKEIEEQFQVTNVFTLYEKNIGVIPGSQVAEELIEAEKTYPAQWLEDAFDEAVAQDVRRWAYIRAILASWSNGGRGNYDGKTGGRNSESRYKSGKYGKVVRST